MRMLTFAGRNAKEMIRDPLNFAFGLGFPLVLLFLLSAIQANIPVSLFEIDSLTPGIAVFGLSFMTLFSATLVAKDRESALLQRLYTTPLTGLDFIMGYMLPLLPIALAQSAVCCLAALPLGLTFTIRILYAVIGIVPMAFFHIALAQGMVCYLASMLIGLRPGMNIIWALLFLLPVSLLFIGLGLLCGSVLTDKQVGGICGALLTNLCAWLSGIWFDLKLIGGTFERIAHLLPFAHATDLERTLIGGSFEGVLPHLLWIMGYSAVILCAAAMLFLRQMKRQ